MSNVRMFPSGATRDTDENKLDYEGFLHPAVIKCFAEYMHKNRYQSDGTTRASDNWQKGMPKSQYMKSLWRHFMEIWTIQRTPSIQATSRKALRDALCATMFNVMGMLFEDLKETREADDPNNYEDLDGRNPTLKNLQQYVNDVLQADKQEREAPRAA